MTVITRVTRPCGCVIEHECERDGSRADFLLVNWVCENHEHLKSTVKGERHAEQANHVMDIIEEAKRDNLADWEATLMRARSNRDRLDVLALKPGIVQFNQRITEEWQELTSNTHAFDSHIHTTILNEIKQGKWQIQDS